MLKTIICYSRECPLGICVNDALAQLLPLVLIGLIYRQLLVALLRRAHWTFLQIAS